MGQFATTTKRTITTKGAYIGTNSRECLNSKLEAQQKKDSTRNGYQSPKKKGLDSIGRWG